MSSDKTQKWSSSTSLSKLLSRISRTLSFSSKKSQQTLKKNNKKLKTTETFTKNVNFVPQSVPIIRRHPPQTVSKILYNEKFKNEYNYQEAIIYENNIEREDDDYSRYSLRPNLSLFNISVENLNYQSEDYYEQMLRPADWSNNIFHSTKIEDN